MLRSRGYITSRRRLKSLWWTKFLFLSRKKCPNWMSFSSLNCTKCVSHRGICIGNESLFSQHGLRPSLFQARPAQRGWGWGAVGYQYTRFCPHKIPISLTICKTFDTECLKLPWNKVFQDWDRPSNLLKTSISVQGQGASRYGRGKAASSPRNVISSI